MRRPGSLALLVVVTIGAGVLAATAGIVLQWSMARDTQLANAATRTLALASELAIRVDARIEHQTELVDVVASRRPVATATRDAAARSDATAELRGALGVSRSLDELFLFDLGGRAVAAAANGYLVTTAEADARYRPDRRPSPSARLVDEQPTVLEISVPVDDPPGTPSGVLVGRLPFESVGDAVLRLDLMPSTSRFVVDDGGTTILHADRERVLQRRTIDVSGFQPGSADVMEMILDGRPHIVAVAPLEHVEAYAVVAEDVEVALAAARDQRRGLIGSLVAVIVAIVAAIVITAAWLLAPLRPLVSAVRRLGRQDVGVRVDERGIGEVAAVAAEFNRLGVALDEQRSQVRELQRLSVLIGTRTDRARAASEAVDGAIRLTCARWAVFCEFPESQAPVLRVAHGPVDEVQSLETGATARREERTCRVTRGADDVVGVPIRDVGGRIDAVLVVSAARIDDETVGILEAYAAFAGVALDNVERLELQHELASELADAVELRRRLIDSVSVELRTPLMCIDGFVSVLRDGWDELGDGERRDLVERVGYHVRQLDELVGRLLDFALVERGALDATLGPVRLDATVDWTLWTYEHLMEGRPVHVDVDEVTVHADAVMLRRTLGNLLSNAIKFSPAGSPVEIRAVPDATHVRVEVVDRGVGLDADEVTDAFSPFWQANDSEVRRARGTGLGLTLVAEYARAMGARVGVVSEPGRGSTFFVVLRRAVDGGPAELDRVD